MPQRLRLPAFGAASVVGLVLVAASWSSVMGLKREGSAEEAEHSVNQRESFAYVSWQMFKDHPLFGVGFGHFYEAKMPYLSDRRQEVELESIRSLWSDAYREIVVNGALNGHGKGLVLDPDIVVHHHRADL